MKETQEMLDFATKHNITPDIEVVPMDYVNTTSFRARHWQYIEQEMRIGRGSIM
ncbi:hypothetical protein H5410_054383 [Solanum commersonii]|uniref:Uncharacterized protein n=1 Tax=Solanum commersonii TaxID=4109 RepID=A0A9J5WES8_SOLCO|nr:hypothetical protein H5410_054383 [Solanum commersonii]